MSCSVYQSQASHINSTQVNEQQFPDVNSFKVNDVRYHFQKLSSDYSQDNQYISPKFNEQIYKQEKEYAVQQAASKYQKDIQDIFNKTNQYRAEKGLNALKYDESLMAYAQKRAEELFGYYSHTRSDGRKFETGITGGGAENVSFGQLSGNEAILRWRNSEGHYKNIIYKDLSKIGIGVVYAPSGVMYWVQVLGFDRTSSPYYLDNTIASRDKLERSVAKIANNQRKLQILQVDQFPILIGMATPNGQWHTFTQNNERTSYQTIMNGYENSRFGLVKRDNAAYQTFSRGNETNFSDMPTRGTATYQGKAVITNGNGKQYLNAAFQVDFSKKTIVGILSQNGKKVADIQARIHGKSFRSLSNSQLNMEGEFFGKKAEELGGVFYDHSNNKYGAFGAKK